MARFGYIISLGSVLAAAIVLLPGAAVVASLPAPSAAAPVASDTSRTSADWLNVLPDGPEKRQFILDCTGCHQLRDEHMLPRGARRSAADWSEVVARMLRYAGPTTSFPVISAHQVPERTGEWLARHLPATAPTAATPPANDSATPAVTIREYLMPIGGDLPHDVAVEEDGTVVITGMMTNRMYTLDPASGAMGEVAIPLDRANPRAVEIDSQGNWWVVLGAPQRLARYLRSAVRWEMYPVDMYPHSVALAPNGTAWVNGHFTRAPELIASVNPAGEVARIEVPAHPSLAREPGGPIPYEIRAAPDGTIWLGELQGNRLIAYDPATQHFRIFTMPTPNAGPRRFDIDAHGMVWIPAYGANELVRLDPSSGQFTAFALPVRDAVPYVARVDHTTGAIWIGTSAADAVLRFDLHTRSWATYRLPSRGALVRHLAIDPRTQDVWIAYGASPGPPARIARLSARGGGKVPVRK